MVCASTAATREPGSHSAQPYSGLAAFLIERNYADLGCDRWDTRRVRELMAKLGDTPAVLSARLRVRPRDLDRRLEQNVWTKQDGLILTMLERTVDLVRGGIIPSGSILPPS